MAVRQIEFSLIPEKADNQSALKQQVLLALKPDETLNGYEILKKSLDARSKQIIYRFKVEIFTDSDRPSTKQLIISPLTTKAPQAVIVGFGPTGMFAALQLLQAGIKPIVIERGKTVKDRRRDLANLNRNGIVDEDSNYCFGEGGAGTFSDGKLYTRSNKRGDVQQVLRWLVKHGASEQIMYDAHPHIGTNKLPGIVENIRNTIIANGGEIHFNEKLTGLLVENNQLKGITTSVRQFATDKLILATGHSARDVFNLLYNEKIQIENKPFALGVRIEMPQLVIDQIQYRCESRPDALPPASYSVVEQVNGRGVFSFCMCPGGIIAPAATAGGEIVVNGWSPSKRNGKFANSGLVVSVLPDDWKQFEKSGPLAAMHFQASVEQKAWHSAGAHGLKAPAQKAIDFIHKKVSGTLPDCSYIPGVVSADLNEVLPYAISDRISKALLVFNKKMKGYIGEETLLVAPESRTSSPVRIPRHKTTLMHLQVKGLYPCGEGAGYAGGIVSAAIDGMACADKIRESLS